MQKCNENAANRYSYVGEVFTVGERARKREVLASLPQKWRELHEQGFIHIHDLDAYGLTYNCLTFDILRDFPYGVFEDMSPTRKIIATFEYLKNLFTDIGNEQSGGMALANFDNDLATILEGLGVELDSTSRDLIADCIHQLIHWCNHTHTRMGQTSYYVSLNIGLAKGELARFLAETLLKEFEGSGDLVFKPNIIFKVKAGVNRFEEDPNYDLLKAALLCSAKKMIPTYVLCDSAPNRDVDPEKLAIMGCRTRVVADLYGENTSIGRGNIDNISINLPRLALMVEREMPDADFDQKMNAFTAKWEESYVEPTKEFSGIRLLDDLTFSVTVDPQYLPYFYSITYGAFSAQFLPLWLGENDILDDGNGVYLTEGFYAKDGDSFAHAAHIEASAWDKTDAYPYSGPYCVESYNEADKSVTLVKNEFFKGNYEGTVPQISKVIYKKIVGDTQIADFTSGNLDVIAGITGGNQTNEAITLADNSNGKYVYTHYSRAGYGKLGFRGDFGPVQFVEVRQAIAYCMDRATFAKDFTGGFGGVVDGPYYTGSWMFKAAVADGMMLDAYATSADSAIKVLEEGGWVYNAEGGEYTEGVRYKKIPAAEIQEQDITFQSKDGAYKTTKVGDDYYMPLVLNWYGTSNNEFTDLLVTGFMENENIKAAGFAVQNNIGEFNPMLDELYQQPIYGFYSGTPLYTCFNLATGFTSAVYDYSWRWEIEPTMFDNYSECYIKDLADAYWLK